MSEGNGEAPLRTAFVFAGGGSLGAVHVGMLEALLDHGCHADFVVGTSIGAINGSYYAGHPSRQGADGLRRRWLEFKRPRVLPIRPLGGFLSLTARRNHIIAPGPLRRFIEESLPAERIEDAALPCHVVTTDLLNGEEVVLSDGPWATAVLASCAVPGVFPPVHTAGRVLVDGGVCNNAPVSVACELGAERVVVLPTGVTCASRQLPESAIGMAVQAITLAINAKLINDIRRWADRAAIAVVPPLCPLDVSPYDFTRAMELADVAAASTRAWLEGGGLERQELPHELEPHEH
ncbi:MAG: patatin-like phospholipase family protein [Sandaracinaceae bacterium]